MTFKVNENIVIRKIGEDMVLVPVGQTIDNVRSIYKLNSTAAFVLKSIQNGHNQQEIQESIFEEFDVENETQTAQWLDLILGDFKKHDIIL